MVTTLKTEETKARLTSQEAVAHTGRTLKWLRDHHEEAGGQVDRNERGHQVASYDREKLDALLNELNTLADRPPDPDLVFLDEAQDITKCCQQTLYRLADKVVLTRYRVTVLDAWGRKTTRSAFSRTELLNLFHERPTPGQPIHLPNGETWYLREDALRHFGFSNSVLQHWPKKKSRVRPGQKALRKRHFYIIVGRALGSPKKLTAWRGEDLEAIQAGQEGAAPSYGKTAYARQTRKVARDKAEAVLRALKPHLPQLADVALDFVLGQGVARHLVYKLKDRAGIKSAGRNEGKRRVSYWILPGQRVPGAEAALPTLPTLPHVRKDAAPIIQQSAASILPKSPRPVDKDNSISRAAWVPSVAETFGEEAKEYLRVLMEALKQCLSELLAGKDRGVDQPVNTYAREPPLTWKLPWFHGGVLRLNGLELGKFRDNQKKVLQALQKNEWRGSTRVDELSKRQLNDALSRINSKIKKFFLRLSGDGSGLGVNLEIMEKEFSAVDLR